MDRWGVQRGVCLEEGEHMIQCVGRLRSTQASEAVLGVIRCKKYGVERARCVSMRNVQECGALGDELVGAGESDAESGRKLRNRVSGTVFDAESVCRDGEIGAEEGEIVSRMCVRDVLRREIGCVHERWWIGAEVLGRWSVRSGDLVRRGQDSVTMAVEMGVVLEGCAAIRGGVGQLGR
ncbi:hypothetical protein AAG906_020247 [Vitis piasezkii]